MRPTRLRPGQRYVGSTSRIVNHDNLTAGDILAGTDGSPKHHFQRHSRLRRDDRSAARTICRRGQRHRSVPRGGPGAVRRGAGQSGSSSTASRTGSAVHRVRHVGRPSEARMSALWPTSSRAAAQTEAADRPGNIASGQIGAEWRDRRALEQPDLLHAAAIPRPLIADFLNVETSGSSVDYFLRIRRRAPTCRRRPCPASTTGRPEHLPPTRRRRRGDHRRVGAPTSAGAGYGLYNLIVTSRPGGRTLALDGAPVDGRCGRVLAEPGAGRAGGGPPRPAGTHAQKVTERPALKWESKGWRERASRTPSLPGAVRGPLRRGLIRLLKRCRSSRNRPPSAAEITAWRARRTTHIAARAGSTRWPVAPP